MNIRLQKYHILIILIIMVGGAVAWYALSPLFRTKVVEDALPTVTTDEPQLPASPLVIGGETEVKESSSPILSAPFPVVDTPSHPASGSVRIVRSADETILRYENYKTINGPDVRVYLAKDLEAKEYVDLGPLKGTEGNINYTIPKDVDISQYRYALTWCEDFSVLFNSADLFSPQ